MVKKNRDDDLRVRMNADLKEQIDALFARKKITLTDGVESTLQWLLDQPDLVQSIVLGQIEPESSREVLKLLLERSRAAGRGKSKSA